MLAWLRRPENRFGALMVAVGFTYCLSGLIVTTDSWPFIAGLLLIALPYAVLFHILLAFPSGRLESRGDRVLAGAAYLTATVVWWGCVLFEDTARLGVPANPLLVADEPDLFSALARIRLGVVATLIAAARRRARPSAGSESTPAQRRALDARVRQRRPGARALRGLGGARRPRAVAGHCRRTSSARA